MATRLTIDPITRIEGHLRVDVEVNGGKVSDSWASCTMWRGIENILQGVDSREAWLFTQRFCGVCTTVHAMASVRAVEDALDLEIPDNAQFIRNLILIAHAMHDHVVHFYHLCALDWVDVTDIPKADPAKAAQIAQSLSDWPGNSKQEMKRVQDRIVGLINSGQLGIFAHGYWGHKAMKLPPEVSLLATAHYLQALEYQRLANQIVAMLGSKTPHIQNLAVGGVMNAINLDSQGALNMDRIYAIKDLFDKVIPFIKQVYIPDACAVAAFYPEWFGYGAGVTNYLAVPDLPLNGKATEYDLPGGVIMGGDLKSVRSFSGFKDQLFRDAVTEDVTHAYYKGQGGVHPWQGETIPDFTEWKHEEPAPDKYTWVKGPRFEGKPAQVGPLSQVLVGIATGHELTMKWVNAAAGLVSAVNKDVKVTPAALHSTLGRIAARAIRAGMLCDLADKHWGLLANNILSGDTTIFNAPDFPADEIVGVGMHEAPRGTLSHWVRVKGGKITNYQAVVPTTWNASPRDDKGVSGPYEACLIDNPVADPERPLEVLRTVHSFDPCMACACHTHDPEGNHIAKVKVL